MAHSEDNSPELYTASDMARFCQVDLKTIHNWADRGNIRHFRTQGRHLRFRRVDIVDFLRQFGYPMPEVIRAGRPKLAAVDDDPNALAALRRVLSRRFDLTVFQDPFDALIAVGTMQPDALILDIRMPGIDGVRFLERLGAAELTAHIRTVVYSSHEDMREAAEKAGARAFVLKGEVSELRQTLERLTGLD
jgi:excisionase family DNA binding protein